MSALPNPPEPTDFSKQEPFRLNDGFARPEQPQQQPDVLEDDDFLRTTAMDARGSRQIAPYATYEAVDAALENGYYTGLEALDFGTLADGTPAAMFTDKNGQRQAIRMSEDRWFAAMQQRAQGRVQMAKRLRNQRNADRIRPAISDMAKELEAYAPGFQQFAEIGLEEDAESTYAMTQNMYQRVRERDEAALSQLRTMIDKRQMQVIQGLADNWVSEQNDVYMLEQEGYLANESIPEVVRVQRAYQIKRWQQNVVKFGYLSPPAADIARNASFPSFYFSQSNPGALEDAADMAIQLLGQDNINNLPQQMRIPMLLQEVQRAVRGIGWSRPFDNTDLQIMSQVIQHRLSRAPIMQIVLPDEMAQRSEREQMRQSGLVRAGRAEQAQRQYESQMQEAKLQGEQARGFRTQAEAERTRAMTPAEVRRAEATAASKQAEADIMRGAAGGQAEPSVDDMDREVRARVGDLGIAIPAGVPALDFLADTAEKLARSADPADKARLQQIVRIVQELTAR
jgi:hypothetical protein